MIGGSSLKWYFRLQFFAEEKTEEATSKRKQDARQEGQIVKSNEVNTVVVLFSSFIAIVLMKNLFYEKIGGLISKYFRLAEDAGTILERGNTAPFFRSIMTDVIVYTLPMLLVAFVASLISNVAQVGFLFTTKPLQPKLSNISPLKGFKKIFSKQSVMELFKSIAKILLVGYVGYHSISEQMDRIINSAFYTTASFYYALFDVLFQSLIKIFGVLLIIAAVDYFFKWRQHRKSIRMSKQEIKEEFKQQEGDPQVKSKRKQKQQEMAMSRMMQSIPKADVIITNPTHYSVAIQYDAMQNSAPILLAKGMDLIALKIREVAKEHKIPIVENKMLARTIYSNIEIGNVITEDLYEAVAEVLAYIYSLR